MGDHSSVIVECNVCIQVWRIGMQRHKTNDEKLQINNTLVPWSGSHGSLLPLYMSVPSVSLWKYVHIYSSLRQSKVVNLVMLSSLISDIFWHAML